LPIKNNLYHPRFALAIRVISIQSHKIFKFYNLYSKSCNFNKNYLLYFVVYNNLKTTIMKTLYIVLIALSIVSCQNQSNADMKKAKQASIDSMKVEIDKQRVMDSMKTEMAKIKEEQRVESQKEVVVVHQQAANGNSNTATTTTTTKKKGWSATAKGAVIGAGVGAATGAIVSKKKGEGAIIGGLAGAALGTGTGAVIDSKNKKKE